MAHTFHDLNIQSGLSTGDDSISDIIDQAEALEIDRIAITDYHTGHDDIRDLEDRIDDLETDVDVHPGVKVRADDRKELNDKIAAFRDHVDVVVVHGGEVEINRAACEDPRVDVLAHPEFKRKDSGIDHVIAKEAAKNRVSIDISFKSVLKTYGRVRSQIMNHMQRNIRLAQKYNAPLILTSGARRVEEMRRPRDLVGFGTCLGIELSDAFDLVEKHPADILQRAEAIREGDQEQPGVEVEDDTKQTSLDETGDSDG
jgi:ribonuclease P/MRP protein subunit RPP1